ncbi:hypothetical protein ACS0TY_005209 [Phlomoides rotata]
MSRAKIRVLINEQSISISQFIIPHLQSSIADLKKERKKENITSCFNAQSNKAKLIDLHRNTLRLVDIPVTAAELMLEEPGYAVSPVTGSRRDCQISVISANNAYGFQKSNFEIQAKSNEGYEERETKPEI